MSDDNNKEVRYESRMDHAIPILSAVDFEDRIITNENFKNTGSILMGIFLYTENDKDLVKFVRKNFHDLNVMTGEWFNLYILEKPSPNREFLQNYWLPLLQAKLYEEWSLYQWITKTKPFDKNESYKIAHKLGVLPDQLPCLVLLPPLTKLSSEEKLVIPISEVSAIYFRKLLSILKKIVQDSEKINKFKAIENQFEHILQYLEENSQKIYQQTITNYESYNIDVVVNSSVRSLKVTEQNNPVFNIKHSNIASVTGEGKIDTAIANQYNYSPEQRQTLVEAAAEIQALLAQLSEAYTPSNSGNNLKIAQQSIEKIDKNSALKAKIIKALKSGGTEAFKELIDHPAINIFMALVEGWTSTE